MSEKSQAEIIASIRRKYEFAGRAGLIVDNLIDGPRRSPGIEFVRIDGMWNPTTAASRNTRRVAESTRPGFRKSTTRAAKTAGIT